MRRRGCFGWLRTSIRYKIRERFGGRGKMCPRETKHEGRAARGGVRHLGRIPLRATGASSQPWIQAIRSFNSTHLAFLDLSQGPYQL